MIYARKDRYGMLYQFRTGDGEELAQRSGFVSLRPNPYRL
jgi:hypothetical protein